MQGEKSCIINVTKITFDFMKILEFITVVLVFQIANCCSVVLFFLLSVLFWAFLTI